MNSRIRIVAALLTVLCFARSAGAQTIEVAGNGPATTIDLRHAAERLHFDLTPGYAPSHADEALVLTDPQAAPAPAPKHRSALATVGLLAAGVVVGGFAGIFAGYGVDRYVLHRNCACDDPGLGGAITGMFTGAIVMPIVFLKFVK